MTIVHATRDKDILVAVSNGEILPSNNGNIVSKLALEFGPLRIRSHVYVGVWSADLDACIKSL